MKLWRGQPDHNYWRVPFTAKERAFALLGLGACFCLLAVSSWMSPPRPPFTGKWAWAHSWAYSRFGESGVAWLELGVAALLFGMAGFSWLGHRKQRT